MGFVSTIIKRVERMKWNPEDEIEFIVRKLNHELTTAEERQFQCWLAEDQAHRSLFQEIESISLRSKEAKIVFEPDIERLCKR